MLCRGITILTKLFRAGWLESIDLANAVYANHSPVFATAPLVASVMSISIIRIETATRLDSPPICTSPRQDAILSLLDADATVAVAVTVTESESQPQPQSGAADTIPNREGRKHRSTRTLDATGSTTGTRQARMTQGAEGTNGRTGERRCNR